MRPRPIPSVKETGCDWFDSGLMAVDDYKIELVFKMFKLKKGFSVDFRIILLVCKRGVYDLN